MAVEDFLKTEANRDILIRHLKLVGEAELYLAVRGILQRCMTNGLASTFSYNGLREKEIQVLDIKESRLWRREQEETWSTEAVQEIIEDSENSLLVLPYIFFNGHIQKRNRGKPGARRLSKR
ncbi:hypothetical protein JTE90_008673 [Oedothorax gibbosus]|uniref:Uncharacterized protein n=1 Tax=Oedothorax gibbosus TaxID=931172 RepID=A0AAV6U1N8_9ARAC|nr:hypothetical protein JTE90_008673 [Oedothorax gibbosus]